MQPSPTQCASDVSAHAAGPSGNAISVRSAPDARDRESAAGRCAAAKRSIGGAGASILVPGWWRTASGGRRGGRDGGRREGDDGTEAAGRWRGGRDGYD